MYCTTEGEIAHATKDAVLKRACWGHMKFFVVLFLRPTMAGCWEPAAVFGDGPRFGRKRGRCKCVSNFLSVGYKS